VAAIAHSVFRLGGPNHCDGAGQCGHPFAAVQPIARQEQGRRLAIVVSVPSSVGVGVPAVAHIPLWCGGTLVRPRGRPAPPTRHRQTIVVAAVGGGIVLIIVLVLVVRHQKSGFVSRLGTARILVLRRRRRK